MSFWRISKIYKTLASLTNTATLNHKSQELKGDSITNPSNTKMDIANTIF